MKKTKNIYRTRTRPTIGPYYNNKKETQTGKEEKNIKCDESGQKQNSINLGQFLGSKENLLVQGKRTGPRKEKG